MNAERPTWDATYGGRPLGPSAYAASLLLLAEFARGPVCALRIMNLTRDETEAWIALETAGVIRARPREPIGDFQWDVLDLTPYGKVYARQRVSVVYSAT